MEIILHQRRVGEETEAGGLPQGLQEPGGQGPSIWRDGDQHVLALPFAVSVIILMRSLGLGQVRSWDQDCCAGWCGGEGAGLESGLLVLAYCLSALPWCLEDLGDLGLPRAFHTESVLEQTDPGTGCWDTRLVSTSTVLDLWGAQSRQAFCTKDLHSEQGWGLGSLAFGPCANLPRPLATTTTPPPCHYLASPSRHTEACLQPRCPHPLPLASIPSPLPTQMPAAGTWSGNVCSE